MCIKNTHEEVYSGIVIVYTYQPSYLVNSYYRFIIAEKSKLNVIDTSIVLVNNDDKEKANVIFADRFYLNYTTEALVRRTDEFLFVIDETFKNEIRDLKLRKILF